MSLATLYLDSVISRLRSYKEMGEKTLAQLVDDDFYYQPNETSNTIAQIIQHLHGNMMSRWTNFLNEDGEKSWRMRDEEFELHAYSRHQLLALWNEGWDCMFSALGSLREEDLEKTIHIRKEALTAVDAINRQLAHYPYHVGQIVFIAKILKDMEWKTLTIPKAPRKI